MNEIKLLYIPNDVTPSEHMQRDYVLSDPAMTYLLHTEPPARKPNKRKKTFFISVFNINIQNCQIKFQG